MNSELAAPTSTWMHRTGPQNRVRPTLIYVAGFLAAAAIHSWLPVAIANAGTDALPRVAGGALLVGGALLFCWALNLFMRAGTGIMPDQASARLVTYGPYRVSRNPMFVAFSAMYVGLALLLNMAWPLFLLPAVMVVTTLTVIQVEERYMARTFGPAYDAYRRRVPRWL